MASGKQSKLDFDGIRLEVTSAEAADKIISIMTKLGCSANIASQVADHLVEASLSGVESHGVMRILEYARHYQSGYLRAEADIQDIETAPGIWQISGGGGIGIPALQRGVEKAAELARQNGIAAVGIRECGHTGRHGAFAEQAAADGFLCFIIGGGNRTVWRQVAPFGGARAILPTNPWCVAIPGGNNGPVVLDFATSKIAGGWIYAARSAGAQLPEGYIIDKNGQPTTNPDDYFDGGAILPAGEHKGYALAVMAELIAEAMLGPTQTECHWLVIMLDTAAYRQPHQMQAAAEDILSELRNCTPAPGFSKVEIPGEREREHREQAHGILTIPEQTWEQICRLETELTPQATP